MKDWSFHFFAVAQADDPDILKVTRKLNDR